MEVRRLRPEQWAALRDLRLRALTSDPDAFGEVLVDAEALTDEAWQTRADAPDHAVFVAMEPGGFVGMAVGGPAPNNPGVGALYSMWVAPEARGQGIGVALIDAVEGWARSVGYGALGLGVTTTNASAIKLYERVGFVDIGERYPLREGSDLEIQIMIAIRGSPDPG